MVRLSIATALAAVLVGAFLGSGLRAAGVRAQDAPSISNSPRLEFEVASIRLHPPDNSGQFQSSMRTLPNGQVVMTNVSLRTLLQRGYPSRGSQQIVGFPAWAEGKYYDVNVKANRPVSRDEQQEMWRALLTDRLKLAAHYEQREEATYDLLFARTDRRLGPKMKVSTCPAPTPPANGGAPPGAAAGPPVRRTGAEVMASCNGVMTTGGAIFAPRTTVSGLAVWLRGPAGRQVIDKTGLDGLFDVELSYSTPKPVGADAAAPDPNDSPEFFTALQDQLGFKLEPSKTAVEVLVIDHIDVPTEN